MTETKTSFRSDFLAFHREVFPKRTKRERSPHVTIFWLLVLAFIVWFVGGFFGFIALVFGVSPWFTLTIFPWLAGVVYLYIFAGWYEDKHRLDINRSSW